MEGDSEEEMRDHARKHRQIGFVLREATSVSGEP
jgi:hypothetical protein